MQKNIQLDRSIQYSNWQCGYSPKMNLGTSSWKERVDTKNFKLIKVGWKGLDLKGKVKSPSCPLLSISGLPDIQWSSCLVSVTLSLWEEKESAKMSLGLYIQYCLLFFNRTSGDNISVEEADLIMYILKIITLRMFIRWESLIFNAMIFL